jgi:PAS domain S-box-containing protein
MAMTDLLRAYAGQVLETIRQPLLLLDADLIIRAANRAYYQMFHMSPEDCEGQALSGFCGGQWNDRNLLSLLTEAVHAGTPFKYAELAGEFASIGYRMMLLSGERIQIDGDDATMLVLWIEDITEQQQVEEQLRIRLYQQSAVAKLGQRALVDISLIDLMNEAVFLIVQMLDVEFSNLLQLMPERGTLILRAGVGWNEGQVGHAIIPGDQSSVAGYTLLSDVPVIVEDLRLEPRFVEPSLFSEYGIVSSISIIIGEPYNPFGVLGAHTRKPRRFNQHDTHALQGIANVLGAYIKRRRAEEALREANNELEMRVQERTTALREANEALKIDNAERKRTEEMLDAERTLLRTLIDAVPDNIYVKDMQGRFVLQNVAHMAMVGATYEADIIGKTDFDIHRQEMAQQYHADDRAVLDDGQSIINREETVFDHAGTLRWGLTTKVPLLDRQGHITGLVGLTRNITDRKRAEKALQQYAERLRILHEIDLAIVTAQSLTETAETALRYIRQLIPSMSAGVAVFDASRNEAVLVAISGDEKWNPEATVRLPIDETDNLPELRRGIVLEVEDLLALPAPTERQKVFIAGGVRSYMSIPLIAHGELIGSLGLSSDKPGRFAADALDIAREMAIPLAIAIENAHLLETERQRNAELEALRQASLHLTSTLELQPVLEAILDYSLDLIAADNAHIFLYDGERLTFGSAVWDGMRQSQPYYVPRENGFTYYVARLGQRVVITDTTAHPLYTNWTWGGAIVGFPLRIGHEVNGVMSLAFKKPRKFHPTELRALELLADQAAIAIQNARLYQDSVRYGSELEQRVTERTAELRAALAKEKELNELKSRFVSMVSHEFRTPLAVIQSAGDLLKHYGDRLTAERRREQIEEIEHQIRHLTGMLEDILAISKADTVGLKLNMRQVSLAVFCFEIVREIRLTTKTHDIDFVAEGNCPPIQIDPKLMKQAVGNLLTNAVKYSPPSSKIWVTLTCEGTQAVLAIQDEGIGIPPEQQKYLFDVFFRAENVGTISGTGLGLAIVKRAVEAHGGSVSVESTVDVGTTFKVLLPLTYE